MDSVKIDDAEVSRFILGSNPFSGFSHQSPEIDSQMKHYYTSTRIKETLADAESCGITTLIARADHHMIRVLMEYWDEGGEIQWFAQTCPEVGSQPQCIARAIANGAKAVYIHGGYVDNLLANDRIEEVKELIDQVHQHDIPAGMAGHNPDVFRWAEKEKLPVDYYMCSYYNSAHRDKRAEHVPGQKEWFLEEDRRIMSELIQDLSKPVIHYKIMAAGRNDPKEALTHVVRTMRPNDAVCVGVFTRDMPDMIARDVNLLEEALENKAPDDH